jgi:hypothetical protein
MGTCSPLEEPRGGDSGTGNWACSRNLPRASRCLLGEEVSLVISHLVALKHLQILNEGNGFILTCCLGKHGMFLALASLSKTGSRLVQMGRCLCRLGGLVRCLWVGQEGGDGPTPKPVLLDLLRFLPL